MQQPSEQRQFHTPPKEINGFSIPKWWECQWRRVRCEKSTCTFCGRMYALEKLMDAQEAEAEEEADAAYQQVEETIQYQAKDLGLSKDEVLGGKEITEDDFDEDGHFIPDDEEDEDRPPEPNAFLWYRYTRRFGQPIVRVIGNAHDAGEPWAHTEAAEDIMWYASLLPMKVYRQLATRWEVRHASESEREETEEFAAVELAYTGYVIRETLAIIDAALAELAERSNHPDPDQFAHARKRLKRFRPHVEELTT